MEQGLGPWCEARLYGFRGQALTHCAKCKIYLDEKREMGWRETVRDLNAQVGAWAGW